jgi:hypothetical protein
MKVIESNISERGQPIDFIAQTLGKPEAEIRSVIQFMVQEGLLYPTIDDGIFTS